MSEKDRVERVAKWLNNNCVDWPPIGYDWDGKANHARRAQMRVMARDLLKVADGQSK